MSAVFFICSAFPLLPRATSSGRRIATVSSFIRRPDLRLRLAGCRRSSVLCLRPISSTSTMSPGSSALPQDAYVAALVSVVVSWLLLFFGETVKRGVFDPADLRHEAKADLKARVCREMTADVFICSFPLLPRATSSGRRLATGSSFVRPPDIRLRLAGRRRSSVLCLRPISSTPSMSPESVALQHDACVAVLASGVALGLLLFWGETGKRGFFDQLVWIQLCSRAKPDPTLFKGEAPDPNFIVGKMNRKLVHISVGLVFMLFWPLFSPGHLAPFFAALAPGINIIRMLLLGLGIWKNEAAVKSMSREGHYRELLKGPLYYACTITLATLIFWRTSPISIGAICNLCAGDGVADIVGRRFGKQKLPYNPRKSFSGTLAMAVGGFLASIVYMHYFASFGYIEESWGMILGFFLVSVAAALVESLPISTDLDDNLTVPLTSLIVGAMVF